MSDAARDRVFISYSHLDHEWLEKLRKHLKPYEQEDLIKVWADTQISTGAKWNDEICKALASAKVAVLLVSANFLNSDFIADHELPPLLEAAEKHGTRIVWVPVSPSSYEITKIRKYQAAHPPEKPLSSLSDSQQDQALVEICKKICAHFEQPTGPRETAELDSTDQDHGSAPDALRRSPAGPHTDGAQSHWTVDISQDGTIVQDGRQLSDLVTELILALESGRQPPEFEVHLRELSAIESALSAPGGEFSNAMRLQLTRQASDLRELQKEIARAIRVLSYSGRKLMFDPDQIAACLPTIVRRLMARSGISTDDEGGSAAELSIFPEQSSALCISISLSPEELQDVLADAGGKLCDLQFQNSCARLPRGVLLSKAFPAIIVEVVSNRVSEDDDVSAAKQCNYRQWLFGLA